LTSGGENEKPVTAQNNGGCRPKADANWKVWIASRIFTAGATSGVDFVSNIYPPTYYVIIVIIKFAQMQLKQIICYKIVAAGSGSFKFKRYFKK